VSTFKHKLNIRNFLTVQEEKVGLTGKNVPFPLTSMKGSGQING